MYAAAMVFSGILLILSVPIFLVFGIGSSSAAILGLNLPWSTLIQVSFGALTKHVLIAVPLFIFAGMVMLRGGAAKRLVDFATALVGHWPGGLGIAMVIAMGFFAAFCGSILAHEFISSLMDNRGRRGYNAYLGERGVKLSGGQRQRIALARAIIKDAPILVLDEATSALDSEVEAAIQESLETVMAGKTVFAIAHRLSTISHMDRIVVMDEGRIVEEGTHKTLLRKRGVYANFWERQSGGFLGVEAAA